MTYKSRVREMKTLGDRQLSEVEFHDRTAAKPTSKTFYNQGATVRAFNKMMAIAGDLSGKNVLDYGCGTGWSSVFYAKKGAKVTALDISSISLMRAKELAIKEQVENSITFVHGPGERPPLADKFDLVLGVSILHHLDLNMAIETISTVLKPNGRALFMEPIAHNPLINLFRKLTPHRRTVDEAPLRLDFVQSLTAQFSSVNVHGYDLLALAAFVFVPVKAYGLFYHTHNWLGELDDRILQAIPSARKYCWGAVLEFSK